MKHINLTVKFLRQAYKRAKSIPGYGWWYLVEDERFGGCTYECPFHVVSGATSESEAADAFQVQICCIDGFLSGWDGEDKIVFPDECERCFRLGKKLRAILHPVPIDG